MSRRTPLFCLALAVMCLFLTAPKTNGQRVYGLSYIQGDPNTRQIDGQSATWLDYAAAYYYDPAVLGELYDDVGLANEHPLDSGYTEGFGIYPAEIFTHTSLYRPNTRYHVYSTHFIRAYYFYSSCSGFFGGCSFDPFGFSRFFSGTGGGNGNWLGSGFQYFYVQSRRYTLGVTHVSIVTPSDLPPTPTPTPSATPCSTAPEANTPCPPGAFVISYHVTPDTLLPTGVTRPANTALGATVSVATTPAQVGKSVRLELIRVENSGGHIDAQHTGARPLGLLRATRGVTNTNGYFQTTYEPNHLGQRVKIRMTFDNGVPLEKIVTIKVPGLEQLYDGENFFLLQQNDPGHPNYHWGTADANRNLHRVADDYKREYYGDGPIPNDDKLRYNDQGLELGGKFEIHRRWASGDDHIRHREGLNCDVRCCPSQNAPTAGVVPRERWPRLLQIFRDRDFDVGDETRRRDAPHWHLTYTNGQAQAAIPRFASEYIDSTWWASLDRQVNDEEWLNRLEMLEAAQAQGAMPTLDTARGLTRALFNSVEYTNRQRNDEEYVTDLYETYLLREADEDGLNYWLGRLRSDNANGLNGRENLLAIFEDSQEFIDLVTHLEGIAPPNTCNPAERQQCINRGGIWDPDNCTCIIDPDPCLSNELICR